MDNLETIWNQETYDFQNQKVTSDKLQSISDKLTREQTLTKKYRPLQFLVIFLFGFIFSYVIYLENSGLSISQVVGIFLVLLSGVAIGVLPQIIKIPLDQSDKKESSTIFLGIIKQKLDMKRLMLIIGAILQIVFLAIGLYILIFYKSNDIHIGYKFTFWGFMFGLLGASIGGSIASFNKHYKDIYQVIIQFNRG